MLPRMLTLMLVMAITFPLVSTAASPTLEISPKEHNFGEVQFGKQATARFTVRNVGSEALVIRRVRTSCGCTKAELSSRELPPKEPTELTVTFDSSGLSAGKKIKTVFLESNDRDNPITKVSIFATVIREVVVEPDRLVTRIAGFKDRLEFSLTALNRSTRPIILAFSSIQGSLTKAVLHPQKVTVSPDSESSFTVTLELTGTDNPKYFNGRLILESNHPGEKWIGMPYFIKVDKAE